MELLALLATGFHLLGLGSAVHALMSTRTSQGTIAWVVSLISFPYLAVPAYWVLGRNKFRGYVTSRQAGHEQFEKIARQATDHVADFIVPPADEISATRAAERLAKMPVLRGNDAELLLDGCATFNSIFEGLGQAQQYVLVQFFTVRDDDLGKRLKASMIALAQRGVSVYFLYDEIGSHDLSQAYKNELRSAGVNVRHFHTRKGPGNRFQLNFRNHCKIVVVDGRVAWIGGHNVGDEYLGKDPKFGRWRDTHVRIEGPAALGAQLSFVEDWHWSSGTVLDLSWHAHPAAGADWPVLIVPSGPADDLETAGLMFTQAINSACQRVWIASPYFVPDEAVMAALQLAGLRGVDVRILIPDKPDHLAVYLCAFSYLEEAGSTGVKFYRYQDGFLHQKVMLVDDRVAAVGTANFDNRSFRLNFEITALIAASSFVSEVEQMFLDDFEHSRLMEPGEYDQKPFWFRLAVRVARLTAPLQ